MTDGRSHINPLRPVEVRQGSGLGEVIPAEQGRERLDRYAVFSKPPFFPRAIKVDTEYRPEGSPYWYQVSWTEDRGYRIRRRASKSDGYSATAFWVSGWHDNWTKNDGGSWIADYTPEGLPAPYVEIALLETLAEAEAIITADCLLDHEPRPELDDEWFEAAAIYHGEKLIRPTKEQRDPDSQQQEVPVQPSPAPQLTIHSYEGALPGFANVPDDLPE